MSKLIIDDPTIPEFKIDNHQSMFNERSYNIKSVRLEILNFDEEYKKDLEEGKAFLITNEEDFNDKTDVKAIDGLYSPLYGISSFDDDITDDCYRCDCGKLTGSINEGETCPDCGTKVQFIDSKFDIFGYINVGKYPIINPAAYSLLIKLIGEVELNGIVSYNNKFDISGKNRSAASKQHPYAGIGFIKFHDKFDEICEFYRDKKGQFDAYDIIMKNKDAVFAHYIPVYSALLRPLIKDDSKISVIDDNRSYSIILANANAIRASYIPNVDKTVTIENSLHEIMNELYGLDKDCKGIYQRIVSDVLSGKKGVIRGMVTTNRLDFSSRCVIVPGTNLCSNEVDMPYCMGVELMRPLICRELQTTQSISIRQANTKVDNALRVFDKAIWFIMNYIITKANNPPRLMVQRSPSLLQESIRLMKIRMIKPDIHDLTLSVPVAILSGMNADFDGDTFSIIMIFDNRLKDTLGYLQDPVHNFISRHDGRYSSLSGFIKDSAVTLSELWNMGKNDTYNEYYNK